MADVEVEQPQGAGIEDFYCESTGRMKTFGRETFAARVEKAIE